MATFFNKWFLLSLFPLSIMSNGNFKPMGASLISKMVIIPHPFHVSVVEMEHNATDKTLEISCKLFTDDFESILAESYKIKVDLINPPVKSAMDSLVKKYFFSHLALKVNGQPVKLSYVGFEHENEAVFGYIEVEKVTTVNKIEIVNNLMYDLFDDQVNIIHITTGGKRISTKLNYPDKQAVFNW
jgi:hypothetical protein